MDSDSYRNDIDRVIREMKGEPMLNGSHEHASIIVERMFAHARDCVLILTRRFDPRVYGTHEAVAQAGLYLGQSDRRCRILVEELDESSFDNHPFVHEMHPYLDTGNLEIRKLSSELAEIVNVNFSVMDNSGFRFEQDKKEAVAIAAFGSGTEKFVGSLCKLFETLWDRATIVRHTKAVSFL